MACHYDCFFINGVWVKPHSDDVISLENPATGEVFAHVPDGTPEDVANAIEAAAQAQPAWAATPLCQRIERMQKALEIFRTYREEIIRLEALELGSPVSFSANSHCDYQFTRIESYIQECKNVPLKENFEQSTVVREPVGVVLVSRLGTIRSDKWFKKSSLHCSWAIRWFSNRVNTRR